MPGDTPLDLGSIDTLMRELGRAPELPPPLAPGAKVGPYEVVEIVGAGGMGTVYRARDPRLGRDVALKLLGGEADRAQWWRFEQEARALAAVEHPNIVRVFDLGSEDGHPFLVLELLAGVTLRQRLDERAFTLAEAIPLALQLVRGLAAAHDKGIVHRDLKPENLFLTPVGELKILDFGIAKLTKVMPSNDSTGSGVLLGTAGYVSPEQARGKPVDARSDLFAVGAVLYELIAGKRAFDRATLIDTLHAILHDPAPPLGMPALDRLLDRCLAKEPEQRFASARELEAALLQLDREPAPSRPRVEHAPPETRYARSGDVHIAYQVVGAGPFDMVMVPGMVSHVEHLWEEPEGRRFLNGLASFSRLIFFDKRGTGLSDRVPEEKLPTLAERMDDVRAVLDAAGSKEAVLFGLSEGGPLSILHAVTYPERTRALVLYGTQRKFSTDEAILSQFYTEWGTGRLLSLFAPSVANDPRLKRWMIRWERFGASPGAARAILRMAAASDVRDLLPQVKVPTLILHRTGDRVIPVAGGRKLAEKIVGSRYVEVPGDDHFPVTGDSERLVEEIRQFLEAVVH
jgi:pimeloyl-ACP methyl ester carboxylesterase